MSSSPPTSKTYSLISINGGKPKPVAMGDATSDVPGGETKAARPPSPAAGDSNTKNVGRYMRQTSEAEAKGLISLEEKLHIQQQLNKALGETTESQQVLHGAEETTLSDLQSISVKDTIGAVESDGAGSTRTAVEMPCRKMHTRRAESTAAVATYEVQRTVMHSEIFGAQGKLRTFWSKVRQHQQQQLAHTGRILAFIRDVTIAQETYAKTMMKISSTTIPRVKTPELGIDTACNEMLDFSRLVAKEFHECSSNASTKVLKDGFEAMLDQYKKQLATLIKRASKMGKNVDNDNASVLKAHRSYLEAFAAATINDQTQSKNTKAPRARDASQCLWTAETAFTKAAKRYEHCCQIYRSEMGKLYQEYQRLELDRITRMQDLLGLFLRRFRDVHRRIFSSRQTRCALAAIEELHPEQEVVLSLNLLTAQNTPQKSAENNAEGSLAEGRPLRKDAPPPPVTSEISGSKMLASSDAKVLPPSPLQSKLLLKTGTLCMRAGLLRSWKPYHCVVTTDGYMHAFDPAALLKKSNPASLPSYTPSLSIDITQSTASLCEGSEEVFEISTSRVGFLGMSSSKKHVMRVEKGIRVDSWLSIFRVVREAILLDQSKSDTG